MTYFHPDWLEGQRQRWMRPDAERFMRPDWRRYVRPGFEHEHPFALVERKAQQERPCLAELDISEDRREQRMHETAILRLQWHAAAIRFELALRRHDRALKYGFNPNQPRAPAGNPDGGQWTREGIDEEGLVQTTEFSASRRRRGGDIVRKIGGRLVKLTPDQQLRFDVADRQARDALRRVKDVDPNWRPKPGLHEQDIEGEIRKAKDLVLEAEARLVELGYQSPVQLIQTYRGRNNALDLFGRETWPRNEGVVAFSIVDGLPVFGVNSRAPTFTTAHRAAADRWRDALVDLYPDEMQGENFGRKPNDALYHAEASALLRAAESNGGHLLGRTLKIYVDAPICNSCRKVLPLLARELGNPTIFYVDATSGERVIVRDGRMW